MNVFVLVLLCTIISNSCFGQSSGIFSQSSNVESNYSNRSTANSNNSVNYSVFASTNAENRVNPVLARNDTTTVSSASNQAFDTGINIHCACDTVNNNKNQIGISKNDNRSYSTYWRKCPFPLRYYKKLISIVGYPPNEIPSLRVRQK